MSDRDVLRELGRVYAEIAYDPVQETRKKLWSRMNGLERVKPMVLIYQVPWHELECEKLKCVCIDPFLRTIEERLRRTIHQWRNFPGDMTVEPYIACPLVIRDTGFGISEDVDVARTDDKSDVVSRHFHIQIKEIADVAKIKDPVVTYDQDATERNYALLSDIFDGVVPVRKRGRPGFWFAPWDLLVRWYGVTECLTDMYENPDLVHASMERLVSAYLVGLDQYEAQGLLAVNDENDIVGSGGYGYTDRLLLAQGTVRAANLWGCGAAQIFSDVSPSMHEEFALNHELRWLGRFGRNYYGCCDPLHGKIDMVRKIPNLAKVSMSPWANVDLGSERIAKDFVFSYKPSPSVFVKDGWDPRRVRETLSEVMRKTRNNVVEVILKDLSTVEYRPDRLAEWSRIASEVTEEFA